MLDSDAVTPDRKELAGDKPDAKAIAHWNAAHGPVVELPANENVGTELDAADARNGAWAPRYAS